MGSEKSSILEYLPDIIGRLIIDGRILRFP